MISAIDGWAAVWPTQAWLDGPYTCVARAETPYGGCYEIERSVIVDNSGLELELTIPGDGWLSGSQSVAWSVNMGQQRALTITLDYSPDAGRHWLAIGESLASRGELPWDTTKVPDSRSGRLRLAAANSAGISKSVQSVVQVNNVNTGPLVALTAPAAGSTVGESLQRCLASYGSRW